ncbi:DUF2306 domain-containing protein [Ectothiorhodospiraceae bacterium 2226]|nr:DUF2306 domain-containing protein [Ectothiorhodospiraceae bacterium 2226]
MTTRASRAAVLWGTVAVLTVLGLLVTAGHYLLQVPPEEAVARGLGPSPEWHLEQRALYEARRVWAALHILPSMLFVLLAPLQLSARLRAPAPALHRANGRLLVALGLVIAVSAVALGILMPFGGRAETWVTLVLAGGFLLCLGLGVRHIRRGQVAQHRAWMARMLAIAYAPLTMRLVLALGTDGLGLDGRAIFAAAMMIGALLNLAAVEIWLRRIQPTPARRPGARLGGTSAGA